jgi:hypothetical protein
MPHKFDATQFAVKFWLGAAALTSAIAIFLSIVLTVHAKSQHVDWWALYGTSRLMAITLPWAASVGNYRRTKAIAAGSSGQEGGLIAIPYSNAFMLSQACTALVMVLVATAK